MYLPLYNIVHFPKGNVFQNIPCFLLSLYICLEFLMILFKNFSFIRNIGYKYIYITAKQKATVVSSIHMPYFRTDLTDSLSTNLDEQCFLRNLAENFSSNVLNALLKQWFVLLFIIRNSKTPW